MPIALVILAAGQGTRMNSDRPKVLHQIGGAPLIAHAMHSGAALEPERVIVVTGHGAAAVEKAVGDFDPEAICIRQDEQLGTGHAVLQAAPALDGFAGDVIVLYGDTPFISTDTLSRMVDARANHDIVVLGFEADDPGRYGRLVMEGDRLTRIVEAKDATPDELANPLCNSGLLAADAATLMRLLAKVETKNAAGEYYLTDVPALAAAEGLSATAITCPEAETLGINTRAELAGAEALFQTAKRAEMLDAGVTLTAPSTVHFAYDTHIGRDAVVEQNVVFAPGVTVESGATIRAFSHLEGAHVGADAIVGPYARLRPGAELGNDARIGNFVEVKAAQIGEGAKVNHLSYIGDATIGTASNIGAGTITCNYDGVMKHQTQIGARAFIGSNTMLVAPVKVGADAMTASGSVITEDVPDEALAVARGKQINKPGLAAKLMARLRAIKAKQKGQ
ncbi:bifunctional UDP-N-acetylglucosamine diphosphorylase/glucosamine-1-phosphate N-acetyltransferase GlmU [Roseobacter sp. HKCCD9010]|uniref:bifunctional UDP-N-acetylglucosamine diphosphorylase/glucosamine-1-phosphate N-acetyltransferase GlmU n=1 Tax=unclassified Roseobacter TaxID=196798 RepID=UPI00149169BE|nr:MULTISPECIES: bifunctional UDP-N-acetylglucosamine diphosphorylase/glucosamine-1-phosphate N-acetyltransferase GlmU [unclassified Roseobacter]MBF9049298.1 bifunctional UDP-N-acetylglucosamine diphosphorylase/glucosamine-1-phosphate N-acetyltransferase GlmU [Rhodobacterales bacterium HKCCD4356]NNV11298.1 bifunctional UDP-N-acetylglucosamine diphosphorylase/glucosamine-1-phosphate N-acetyltransferase GlmU [Roseobacter sp. HKCCD7357]NNV15482.1 bifunctional UDP-N-acetylglucosamine diphosphorylase